MARRLGRGLNEIIPTYNKPVQPNQQQPVATNSGQLNFVMIPFEQIKTGKFQPRETFNEKALEELKASIKRQGVIEPIIVRPVAQGTYELVAGERRYKASQAIGNKDIPSIIRQLTHQEALEIAIVENVQRENLNPIEEAKGYAKLLDEFGYTQEDVAATVGKERATVANMLRLLKLSDELQQALRDETITMGHAKVLLGVENTVKQLALFHKTAREGLSVRQLELLASAASPKLKRRVNRDQANFKSLEDEMRRTLGTRVRLMARKKGGRIVIEYFSQEDLSRILHVLGIESQNGTSNKS